MPKIAPRPIPASEPKAPPYLKPTANVFINVGDTYFGSGAGAWNKYLDENGNITQTQRDRKEKYFTTKPLQPKIKQNGKLYQNKQLLLIFLMLEYKKGGVESTLNYKKGIGF